jgi:hypothetical protein
VFRVRSGDACNFLETAVKKPSLRMYRIVALFMFGWLLFTYPVLALFNVTATVAGIPVLYVYLFTAWAVVIAIAAAVFEGRG